MPAPAEPAPCVLLDRDGVLNVERDGLVVTDASRWRWIDGAAAAIGRLMAAGRRVAVASNQSLIGRGAATRAQVDVLHDAVFGAALPGALDFVLLCPHRPDAGCGCRKPAPGLLDEAVARWEVAPERVLFVGDALTDWHASRAAQTRFALVRTGKGAATEAALADRGELASVWGGRAFADLGALVDALLDADRAEQPEGTRSEGKRPEQTEGMG